MNRRAAVSVVGLSLLAMSVSDAGIESFANPCETEGCDRQSAPLEAVSDPRESTEAPGGANTIQIDGDSTLERLDPERAPIMRSARPTEERLALRVEGYRSREYVYGELYSGQHATLEGYVYRADGTRVYIYGEQSETGRIEAYDRQGQLFLLTVLER